MITIPEHKQFAIIPFYPGIRGAALVFCEEDEIYVWAPGNGKPQKEILLSGFHDYLFISLISTTFEQVRKTYIPLIPIKGANVSWKHAESEIPAFPVGSSGKPTEFLYYTENDVFPLCGIPAYTILQEGGDNIIHFITNPDRYRKDKQTSKYEGRTVILISGGKEVFPLLFTEIGYDDETLFYFEPGSLNLSDAKAWMDFIIYWNERHTGREPKLKLYSMPAAEPSFYWLFAESRPKTGHKITFITFISETEALHGEPVQIKEKRHPFRNETVTAVYFREDYATLMHIARTASTFLGLTHINVI